ncbi:TetR/AcrR family transcriptional regulator [Actinotalea sp. M2MS4P-6]|uniref:TetR/AcrR family transcriptional regulator n=1 Tax=Actinotalea sp. M2MS4P-6 TaxID=2983762 RepID=UPI0021E3C270|nr:TetR/AcrR family transcriptional regulator [Actinotalea sp. M2MS4P-6]MCV2393725.1 TetR/AcrR family transcriptional regulator [Actinotalea sp. M2MS4P-6]
MSQASVAAESARRARTRERLMDAAFEVFAEVGVAASSVEQITERAGFTRGAFYSNFSSKEELFLALIARGNAVWVARLTEQVEELLPDSTGTGPTIIDEDVIGRLVAGVLSGPYDLKLWGLVQSEFRMMALRDPALAKAYEAHRAQFERSLAPIVEEGVRRAGRRLRLDPLTTSRLLMAYYKESVDAALVGSATDPNQVLDSAHRAVADVIGALTEPV